MKMKHLLGNAKALVRNFANENYMTKKGKGKEKKEPGNN